MKPVRTYRLLISVAPHACGIISNLKILAVFHFFLTNF